MEKIEKVNSELFTALAKAQAAFPVVEKNRTAGKGSSFSYKYADISDIIEAIKPHLAANGLSFTQSFDFYGTPAAVLVLKTTIHHSSGESHTSCLPMPDPSKMKPQDFGSVTTYMRRYGLGALIGIASDEDIDGALTPKEKTNAQPERKPAARLPEVSPAGKKAVAGSGLTITEPMVKRMFAIATSKGVTKEQLKEMAVAEGHEGSSKEIKENTYKIICDKLLAMPDVKK